MEGARTFAVDVMALKEDASSLVVDRMKYEVDALNCIMMKRIAIGRNERTLVTPTRSSATKPIESKHLSLAAQECQDRVFAADCIFVAGVDESATESRIKQQIACHL